MPRKEITRNSRTQDAIEPWTIGASRTREDEKYWVKESRRKRSKTAWKKKISNSPPVLRQERNNQSWWSSRWSLGFLWNQTQSYAPPRTLDISSDNSTLPSNWTRWSGNHGSEDHNELFWIIRAHDLAKSVKFRCMFCREIEAKTETQLMADLPIIRLEPFTPSFHYTACDYFGPYKVNMSRNTTIKHYGVIIACMKTRAGHLELAVNYPAIEFMQTLRRLFAIRGQPELMICDNSSQLVDAELELREMIQGWNHKELKEFSVEKGMRWQFISPWAPHQNGCAEALVKAKAPRKP